MAKEEIHWTDADVVESKETIEGHIIELLQKTMPDGSVKNGVRVRYRFKVDTRKSS